AIVPVEDEIKGQKPVAFVVAEPGRTLDEAEVKRFALANAPAYAHPRFVWVLEKLPLASTNKIDRAALRRMAGGRVDRTKGAIGRAPCAVSGDPSRTTLDDGSRAAQYAAHRPLLRPTPSPATIVRESRHP